MKWFEHVGLVSAPVRTELVEVLVPLRGRFDRLNANGNSGRALRQAQRERLMRDAPAPFGLSLSKSLFALRKVGHE